MYIKWYMSDTHACGHVRGEALAREMNKVCPNHRMDCKVELLLSDTFQTNIMVFQRQHAQVNLDKMRMAQAQGVKAVYEIDDDLFNVPPEFAEVHDFFAEPAKQDAMAQFIREADAVTTTTFALAQALKKYNPERPTWVIENALDVEMWERANSSRQRRDTMGIVALTIGWVASQSHKYDAPLIMPAIERLMAENKNVRLHFIGWIEQQELTDRMRNEFADRIALQEWVPIGELPYHMIDFDIGIAPLMDNDFNRCKSGIKALQYWALGVPVVCTPLTPYDIVTAGEDGLKADSAEDWYRALKSLVDDAALRRKMGAKGRETLIAKHDMRSRVFNWVSVFDKIAALR
ncbi:MAG: glycosyltransferase family 4 protein [Planctomycetota bacterium]|jgi:glycosyltransferase involved in cell wall biosynthesis